MIKSYFMQGYWTRLFRWFVLFCFLLRVPMSFADTNNKVLLWSQEFSEFQGSPPSDQYWRSALGSDGANGEKQYYLPEAASTNGKGNLVLTASRQYRSDYSCYYGACEWTSARYDTLGKVNMQYGLVEARIDVPIGAGTWPAFWLLGANYTKVGWPNCGEIDIAEWMGATPHQVLATVHFAGRFGEHLFKQKILDRMPSLAAGFHTYGVLWLPDEISWFIDGVQYFTVQRSDLAPSEWAFNQPMILVINLAMGGALGGQIEPSLKKAHYTIDWIRYYQVNGYGKVAFY